MSQEAMSHTRAEMTTLCTTGVFKKWINLNDPWEPDTSLLHLFGTLPDINAMFTSANRRQVKCSPQLYSFIMGNTTYAHPVSGPRADKALEILLKHCFICADSMFDGAWSYYQLLSASHNILDMAFVRAVRAASDWLGPTMMPHGYILTWPPPVDDAGL